MGEKYSLEGKYALIPQGVYLRGNEFKDIDTFMEELKRQGYANVQRAWYYREFPQHKVIISRPFMMATAPVTYKEFDEFLAKNGYIPTVLQNGEFFRWNEQYHNWGRAQLEDWHFRRNAMERPDHPATGVSWTDATAYTAFLSSMDKRAYSLPTEAQWEYVARAGSEDIFPVRLLNGKWEGTLDDVAWSVRNSGDTTHPVRSRLPNSYGVYDMLGNTWEWCMDDFRENEYGALSVPVSDPRHLSDSPLKSLKGGSFLDYARSLRPADRFGFNKDAGSDDIGFRCIVPP